VGIGNAIVDVLARPMTVSRMMGIEKGIMQLVERSGAMLYAAMKAGCRIRAGRWPTPSRGWAIWACGPPSSGGCMTMRWGGSMPMMADSAGRRFPNPPVAGGELPTSRSMIFVSPDGERSMNTYLGISSELGPEDVSDAVAGEAVLLFLEGYLYDKPKGKQAFERAAKLCRSGGQGGDRAVGPVLRGPAPRRFPASGEGSGLRDRQRTRMVLALSDRPVGRAGTGARMRAWWSAPGRGEEVILVRGEEMVTVPVNRVVPVDATGAGDQFAAGFLYGLATGQTLAVAGRMGCVAAAEVISHFGARPEADLKALFRKDGLI
jgi:hypothetical protein